MVIMVQVSWLKVEHTAVALTVMAAEAVKDECVPLHTMKA